MARGGERELVTMAATVAMAIGSPLLANQQTTAIDHIPFHWRESQSVLFSIQSTLNQLISFINVKIIF